MFDLLVLAELNPDVVVAADDALAFGQAEQIVDHAAITLGSSGAITASAAVAQGLRVAICGVVGSDAAGELTLDLLRARGIDTSGVVRGDAPTGMTVVLSRRDGDRALLTFPGAMTTLRATDIAPQLLADSRHVHVSSYYLQTALQPELRTLLADVRARGCTTSLDPGWDPAGQWTSVLDVLPEVDVFLPNAQECQRIRRAATGVDNDPVTAAQALRTGTVAIKLGADGAAVVTPEATWTAHIQPVEPVDTTGAGDNFDAGFLAATLDGAPPHAALQRAVTSGTVSVSGWGGTGRHATRDEVLASTVRIERRDEIGAAG